MLPAIASSTAALSRTDRVTTCSMANPCQASPMSGPQSRVPAVRAGQRPVLARNDPLNIFGTQRQQTLPIAAAHCCNKVLHNLDILLNAHRDLSISLYIGSRGVGKSADTDAKLLLHYGRRIVAMKGDDLSTLEVKHIARRDIYCLARGS